AHPLLIGFAAAERTIGRAVRDDLQDFARGVILLREQVAREAAHHHDPAGAHDQMIEDRALQVGRLGQHGVRGRISGAAMRSTKSQTICPSGPPKMPYSCCSQTASGAVSLIWREARSYAAGSS